MPFVRFPKIHRLGTDDNDGILDCYCFVQEKIDGANTSIWIDDGEMMFGSRNNKLDGGFRGFCDYAKEHAGIKKLLEDNPNFHLYGEWLCHHTVRYRDEAYGEFYMFDIFDIVDEKFLEPNTVAKKADEYGIKRPEIFLEGEKLDEATIREVVGKTVLGEEGEGVVIKAVDFFNKWGRNEYAKIVSSKFKEENAIVFGNNKKESDDYNEKYVVSKYCTMGRLNKLISKIETMEGRSIRIEDTSRLLGTMYNDILTEEIWQIQKKVKKIEFKRLQYHCNNKTRKMFINLLNGIISVADEEETNSDAGDTCVGENNKSA